MPSTAEHGDAKRLSELGYAQELLRAMGGFSSFALAFSVISVVTGIVTTYGVGLGGGGGAALGLGWPLVSVGTLFVALAMAELASALPTAGALYHWSSVLGGRGWGWGTAAMNLVGQIAIVAAIDLGLAQALVEELSWKPRLVLPVLAVTVVTQALINWTSVRLVAVLNDLSAVVQLAGVVIVAGLLFALGRKQPLSFLADTSFTTRADGRYFAGFCSSLLLGMYTMTGFDASAHAAEETHDAARKAPRGIVTAVLVSGVFGWILVIALALATSDPRATMADAHPALFVLRGALGDTGGRAAMALALTAMAFCGLSSMTSLSRTLFAFARDGGLPAALCKVHGPSNVPRAALATAALLPLALVLIVQMSGAFADAVFVAVASLATTALYVSYAVPIALGLRARQTKRWTKLGPWNLGGAGIAVAALAVTWTAFVLVVCSFPPNTAGAALLAAIALALSIVWHTRVHRTFAGPPSVARIAAALRALPDDAEGTERR